MKTIGDLQLDRKQRVFVDCAGDKPAEAALSCERTALPRCSETVAQYAKYRKCQRMSQRLRRLLQYAQRRS